MKGKAAREKLTRGWATYDMYIFTLTPQVRTKTGAGGYTQSAGAARPTQVWGVARTAADSTFLVTDGTGRRVAGWLVGPVGALVDVGDRFTIDGLTAQITGVRNAPDGVYAEWVHDGG